MATTVREKYEEVFSIMYHSYRFEGFKKDKASRLANIFAIQNAWMLFNERR